MFDLIQPVKKFFAIHLLILFASTTFSICAEDQVNVLEEVKSRPIDTGFFFHDGKYKEN